MVPMDMYTASQMYLSSLVLSYTGKIVSPPPPSHTASLDREAVFYVFIEPLYANLEKDILRCKGPTR